MFAPPPNPSRAIHRADRASVLIVVLVVCLGLVSLALLFGHSMLMAYRGSDAELTGREAAAATEGAARYVEYLMTNVTNDGDLPLVTIYQSQAVPIGNALFWLIGVPQPSTTPEVPVYGLVDEASKLNLNRASATILQNLPGMTRDLAEAIVSWRSSAGSAAGGTSGAAAGISATSVKDAPFESVEELAQVDGGVDLATLYGNDTNLNHVLDPWEGNGGGGNGQINSGLLEYVTAFSREPKVRRDGTSRVNVTVRSPAMAALIAQTFPGSRGTQLLRAAEASGITVHSVLEFYVRSGMTASELGQITPYLTMSSNPYNVGLVNVNTASATVLACLPGITTQLAGQLVAARQLQSAPSSDLSWVVPILGQAVSIEAGPYLTTRSYQVTADVAATGQHGHGYRRTQFVIDTSMVATTSSTTGTAGTSATASSGTAQIVYRRDLSGLGWALGNSVRQATLTNGGAL